MRVSWCGVMVVGFLALLVPAGLRAQTAPVEVPKEPVTYEDALPLYKDMSFVIAAPKEIQLHKTRAFTVMIHVSRLNADPLPEKIIIKATPWGRWEGGRDHFMDLKTPVLQGSHMEVKLAQGTATVTLNLAGWTGISRDPLELSLSPVENPNQELYTTQVRVRDVDSVTVVKAPTTLPADGKTTGTITVVVKDQFGQPLDDVPCLMKYDNWDTGGGQFAIPGQTDAQGLASFTLPASTQGMALYQVWTERPTTNPGKVDYQVVKKTNTVKPRTAKVTRKQPEHSGTTRRLNRVFASVFRRC